MYYSTVSEENKTPQGTTITFGANNSSNFEELQTLDEAQKLADLLKTPDLSDDNIDLINNLITSALASLVECGCDDESDEVDFTDMSIEEMFDVFDGE